MSSEEGELPEAEEGELPEQEQESGEASGFEEPEPDGFEPHHYTTAYRAASAFNPSFDVREGPRNPASAREYGGAGTGPMTVRSPERFNGPDRRPSHHGSGMPPPSSQPPRDEKSLRDISERQAALREEREKEELSSSLKELTRYVSVQDAMRSLDTVCKDLKSAIKKLEKLAKKTKKAKTDDIELYPDCFQYSRRIMEGLKSVNVVCGTSGISQTLSMELAQKLFKTAMNYRHDTLSDSQKRELEGWVRSTKVLKVLMEDRARRESTTASLNRDATASLPEGLASPQGQERDAGKPWSPGPEGERSTSAKEDNTPAAVSIKEEEQPSLVQREEAGNIPPPPLPPPASPPKQHDVDMRPPPPPPGSVPEEMHEAAVLHAMTTSGSKGSANAAASAAAAANASKSCAFKFKIVVESTAADIRKGLVHGQEAELGVSDNQPTPWHAPTSSGAAEEGTKGGSGNGSGTQGKRSHHLSSRGDDVPSSRSSKKQRSSDHDDGGGRGKDEDGGRHGGGSSLGRHSERDYNSSRGGRERDEDRHSSRHRSSSSREHGSSDRHRESSSGRDRGRGRESPSVAATAAAATAAGPVTPPPESPISDQDEPCARQAPDANGHIPQSHLEYGQGHADGKPDDRGDVQSDGAAATVLHDNGYTTMPDEMVASEEAVSQLLNQGRLCLVLDLDHTLVSNAHFGELSPESDAMLAQRRAAEADLLPEASCELYRMDMLGMWLKLRPGVREFLQRAKDKFELWGRTSGSKAYAEAVLDLLDPSRTLFGPRVIVQASASSNDARQLTMSKRLAAGLAVRAPIAVLLDDSSAAWLEDRRSLLMVERYVYFPASRKRFGMRGKSLLELNRDECPERGMLMSADAVLHRLHALTFNSLNAPAEGPGQVDADLAVWDVRKVMAVERQKVLSGVNLVFSRVIPMEQEPRAHSLWRMAEQFGATCSTKCSGTTTHVVATSRGTEKTFWAVQNGKQVVTPAWLECSCVMWRRACEDRFAVPP